MKMLPGIRCVVLARGTVDLRKGIDGLATIIGDKYGQNPFEMGTGFLLLYKRFEAGRLSWPRNTQEAVNLTKGQYKLYEAEANYNETAKVPTVEEVIDLSRKVPRKPKKKASVKKN